MKNCKFHPTETAMNHCDNCDANFCEPCSDESISQSPRRSRADYAEHQCFVCGQEMTPLLGSQRIPAFWSRLSDVYRYPISAQAATSLLVMSFVAAFLGNAGILYIIPSVAIMLYSFACLRETANGNLKAPGLEACFEGSIAPLFFVILAVVVYTLAAVSAFNYFGNGVGIIVSALVILAAPAAVIVIAVEEKLIPAMNPAALFSVIQATGASYFVMLLFIIIMASSVLALVSFFGTQAASLPGVFVQSLIGNYYQVVTFHIMGYLLYQNQDALGYKTRVSKGETIERTETQRVKAQLEVLIKAGDYQAALQLASKQLKQSDASLWDWSRAFTLSCISSSGDTVRTMFNNYANKLESLNESDKLADAYLQLKRYHPDFTITDHEQRLYVANTLFEAGRYPQVVNMLHTFHQESEDNSRLSRALKLICESLSSIPGREKLANQYKLRYEIQLKKS